jgi:pimeloyl-ACP methyl ester carboxylesterase
MRHISWTLALGLLLAQTADGQDGKQRKDGNGGKQPPMKLPPPTLVPPPMAPGAAVPASPVPGPPQYAHLNCKTVVFVANGAGDSTTLSDNLRFSVEHIHAPIVALNVRWCRFNDPARDHLDQDGRRAAGYRLACAVLAIRRDAPSARIVFMGHSDGTHVILAAAEMLPPASVDRVFLFASTVSSSYCLQPALSASRGGIDAFASRGDGVLETLEETIGSSDGHMGPTAGRVGFAVPRVPVFIGTEKDKKLNPDAQLFANLRQVCWNEELVGAGHGGHCSFIHERFLRIQILPQIAWH